jgi:1-acyl-sn-glycerol-3-phosphate acyltransferase
LRRPLALLLRLLLRLFFRKIEISGERRMGREGAALFALNHPNGLVDAMLLLAFCPRQVSFLAKSTLFQAPFLGLLVRAFGSVPVFRRKDGADPSRNLDSIREVRRRLGEGGAIAIFPEGASHDEPNLLPLQSGAARIALGAVGEKTTVVRIVPIGLFYTDKGSFRSEVLLSCGASIEVHPVSPDSGEEPPREAVEALTSAIAKGLERVTFAAGSHEAAMIIRRAERIFSGSRGTVVPLEEELAMRRRFARGRATLLGKAPRRLARFEGHLRRFEADVRAAGYEVDRLDRRPVTFGMVKEAVVGLAEVGTTFPAALLGTFLNFPAWLLVDRLARRLTRGSADLLATTKIFSGVLVYPLSWIGIGIAAASFRSPMTGWLLGLSGFPLGWLALLFWERFGRTRADLGAIFRFLFGDFGRRRLIARRQALRGELVELGRLIEELEKEEAPAG